MGGVHLLEQSLPQGRRPTMLEPTLISDGPSLAGSDSNSYRLPDDASRRVVLQKDTPDFLLPSPKRITPTQATAMPPTQLVSHVEPRPTPPPDPPTLASLTMRRQFPPEPRASRPKHAPVVCSQTTLRTSRSPAHQQHPDNVGRMQQTLPGPLGCRSADHDLPPLPPGTRPLSHQVAGHVYGKSSSKLGMLECVDGTLLKPLPAGRCGRSELAFYETVWNTNVRGTSNGPHAVCQKYNDGEIANAKVVYRTQNNCTSLKPSAKGIASVEGDDPDLSTAVLLEARKFVPTYLGTYVDPSHPEVTYVRLVDLALTFRRPCIADIKVGAQSYDPDATFEKIAKERAKYPPQQTLHFQLKGMRHYCRTTDVFTTCTKDFLRSLDESQVLHKGFGRFFDNDTGLRRDAISTCLYKLLEIRSWVEKQRKYAFYASSILIIYEGDAPCIKCHLKDVTLRRGVSANTPRDMSRDVPQQVNVAHASSSPTPQVLQRPGSSNILADKKCLAGLGRETAEPDGENKQNNDCVGSGIAGEKSGGACGSETAGEDDGRETDCSCSKVEIKMIDFARVFPSEGVDMNYLEGVNSLMAHLQALLQGSHVVGGADTATQGEQHQAEPHSSTDYGTAHAISNH